tara:strand:- start:1395 stop:2165 length:771 start_codon:yes stop_codon:yes gene_type:complete
MEPEAAIKEGAMALFGEKYGEEVRVVSMGESEPDDQKEYYSTELCGGTHVNRTGDIGIFRLISESAVASGVRRIEAVTGAGALEHFDLRDNILEKIAQSLKVTHEKLPERVISLADDKKKLEREVIELRRKLANSATRASTKTDNIKIGETVFLGRLLQDVPARELKALVDEMKTEIGSGIVSIVSTDREKASLVVGVTKDLKDKFNAIDLVREGVIALGGKGGGGRWDMAQAGGAETNNLQEALERIKDTIARIS